MGVEANPALRFFRFNDEMADSIKYALELCVVSLFHFIDSMLQGSVMQSGSLYIYECAHDLNIGPNGFLAA